MAMDKARLHYLVTVVVIACGSIPKGYDEGGFAGAKNLESFLLDFGLTKEQWTGSSSALASRKANISSFGVLGAAIGAIMILCVADRLGRLRSWQLSTGVWMAGFLMTTFASGNTGLLLFSRIFGGLGAGGLTVVAPLYLSEIAPARSRGMIVSIYMVILLSFLMLGFFISYAAGQAMAPTRAQYQIVIGIALVPVGLAFIASFFLQDTPRWLASQDRNEEASAVLAQLRGRDATDPLVLKELEDMHAEMRDKRATLAGTSTWSIAKEIATIPTFRKRFLLGLAMQTVAQWSGGNGITYYIPEIFGYAGIPDSNQSLIASGAYGAVKLVFTMVFTWGLVDVFGRRRCFIAGLLLQCVTHIYMAIYMAEWINSGNGPASDAAIASIFIYAVGWSIGLCTVQYLYGTEIYPTRIRNVCYATNMMVHWFFQFGVVRVTPNMFDSLDIWGAYVFWACVCAVGLVLLGLWAPETKGVPMERMTELFDGPWYMGWKARVRLDSDAESLDGPVYTETKTDNEKSEARSHSS
ncbi:general substrate transporter [Stachybotrys elegans]|uniref:General substrate transporter n=1 Tax=Stachybotrys elegans TaxID=80388 RepID=A0A8K0SPA0_9HYPO|nr:general substrate transporter [Stachybotrys elegans]